MKSHVAATLAVLSASVLSLSGCAAFTDDGADPASSAGGVEVAAAFYPLAYVAERVGGDHVDVTNLTAPGGEPHDLEPSVEVTAEITEANLVVYERGFQPAVDAAVGENARGDVLDAADAVDLVPFREHGVDSDELDPHFWLDPLLLADVGDAVAEQLADVDPDHAPDYRTGAAELRDDLEQLDQDYTEGLAQCDRTTVVVSHDAFGYLQRYGVDMEAILGLSPDSEPTPADLARLQDLIREDGVTTVFSESIVSAKSADALAEATGARSEVLDPIEGLTDRTEDEDYLSLMRANLSALEEANGC
ncbi:metal ABC transporter substrate-binding protein [Nocardioides sp. T2.26MG-1]|uniref:metal ABC transporter substrate-binding protein n=1 Tax=Nocardioides sp. T2.26MG-1 TaxID=3041166 RepID=UPI002477333A|nr:metal ABC transporter substrate-binding protein [Nocardioides sp. T2.26MG-1]CAI9407118.1 High-affinity zinc uptake system binding-protein ZnuA [Nocardioides sp. T2.26MG-1]